MTTFNEFLESKELEEMVGSAKYPKYKLKFYKVINRAGVGNHHITDEIAINKLGRGSWNWFAFFFTFFWSLYLNITSGRNNQWYFVAIIFAIYFILDFLNSSYEGITQTGFEDLANLVPLCVGIAYGMMGNGFFLQEIVRKFNSGHRGLIPKSNLNIFIFIVVILIFSALSVFLFPDLY